jgi:hypothetical protein
MFDPGSQRIEDVRWLVRGLSATVSKAWDFVETVEVMDIGY